MNTTGLTAGGGAGCSGCVSTGVITIGSTCGANEESVFKTTLLTVEGAGVG